MAFTDYATGGGGAPAGGPTASASDPGLLTLGRLKKQYLDYLSVKRPEISEQQDARRYRHGAQHTAKQVKALNDRKQPVVTYNRISRKINGVVGLVEKMKMDPKAYPRTPKHEEGAELATAVLRYVMDEQDWDAKAPIVAARGAEEGIGGIEILLEHGDQGDVEVGFDVVENEGFFYDPRSFRLDFSDARYMGVGKWIDIDQAKEMFPEHAEALDAALDGAELSQNSDKEQRWFSSENRSVRIVDHWYMSRSGWAYAIYTGSMILQEGRSFLIDEKNREYCKYIMYSANVDHDGDRYGFVRDLKSAQDEINARRSKGLHELNTRRIIGEIGAFDDVEAARREAARPDGVVLRNPGMVAEFDDAAKAANLQGQLEFLQEAKNEIENFGPNPALVGQGVEAKSGRAIALMQQAGIAELGPFILSYRGWKVRVYRALFNAVQRHWSGERWIRVTDNDDVSQFIQINGVGTDPMTGYPTTVNAIGSLDVDIIIDEGPDTVTATQDMYQTLSDITPSMAPMLQPAQAQALLNMLIESSPLDASYKKQWRDANNQAQQPDPAAEQAKMAELQTLMNTAREKGASADLKQAQAAKTMVEAQLAPQQMAMDGQGQPMPDMPTEAEQMKTLSEVELNQAKTQETYAKAFKADQEARLAPQQAAWAQQNAAEDRKLTAQQFRQRAQGSQAQR